MLKVCYVIHRLEFNDKTGEGYTKRGSVICFYFIIISIWIRVKCKVNYIWKGNGMGDR